MSGPSVSPHTLAPRSTHLNLEAISRSTNIYTGGDRIDTIPSAAPNSKHPGLHELVLTRTPRSTNSPPPQQETDPQVGQIMNRINEMLADKKVNLDREDAEVTRHMETASGGEPILSQSLIDSKARVAQKERLLREELENSPLLKKKVVETLYRQVGPIVKELLLQCLTRLETREVQNILNKRLGDLEGVVSGYPKKIADLEKVLRMTPEETKQWELNRRMEHVRSTMAEIDALPDSDPRKNHYKIFVNEDEEEIRQMKNRPPNDVKNEVTSRLQYRITILKSSLQNAQRTLLKFQGLKTGMQQLKEKIISDLQQLRALSLEQLNEKMEELCEKSEYFTEHARRVMPQLKLPADIAALYNQISALLEKYHILVPSR